jgi:hypothetical protein
MRGPHSHFPSLRSVVTQTIIIAYKEDITLLSAVLAEEGFSPVVQRREYSELELGYSRTIRCLLNHDDAWSRARKVSGYTLIVEADFVPCQGFGDLPVPFDPKVQGEKGWAFLYAGGPRVFALHADGSVQGHAACPVAYLISPFLGQCLNTFTTEEFERQPDLTQYSLWDTAFQWYMMGMGARCFMPWRQYGEHGGLPNKEHHKAGISRMTKSWVARLFGVGNNHHADVLYAPLKFSPAYAKGRTWLFYRTRLEAKIFGWLRLFTGRMVMPPGSMPLWQKVRLFHICFRRMLGLY